MDPTVLVIGVSLFLVLVIAMVFDRRRRALHSLSPGGSKAVKLPVVDTPPCGQCKYFSLDGGQQLMQNHPAFAAAAGHIPPWLMGRPRKVKPNPEYDALEAKMYEASKAGEHERSQTLHKELMKLNPGELLPPESYTTELMLKLQWSDFGACGRHSELRSQTDTCTEWEAKP